MQHYMHNVPGRLRVRNKIFKHPRILNDVREFLSTFEGIETVDSNTSTGSITIYYDTAQINVKEIVHSLERLGYFDSARAMNNDQHIRQMVSKAGKVMSRSLFGNALGSAFEGTPLAYLALVI